MSWWRISKSKEELAQEEERKRLEKEEHQRLIEKCKLARLTVYEYADQLKFPSRIIDVRFYNHLFSILIDQQKRIEVLEQKLLEKKK